MKKTLTLIAAFCLTAMMAKAETAEVASNELSADLSATESAEALQVANESAETLVSIPATPASPSNGCEKDLNYWAQAVASRVKVTGYAQAGYTANFTEGDHTGNTNTFDMKRVILMVGVDITKDFYAFFMHDFKSGTMQEYYMEYRPCKAMNFRLGQSKKELSMENPMSPTVLESVGPMAQSVFDLCGTRHGNPSGRELGLMMYGDLFGDKLRYVVEVLNGYKINEADNNNQKDIVAKLEYKFVPNFRFSVSGQKGYANDVAGNVMRSDRYAVGAEWKSKKTGTDYHLNRCTTVRAEALGGRDGANHSFGAYVSAAIPVAKRLDVVSMVDYYNKDTEAKQKQTNFMGGLQYWIHKKCRLQAQYTYKLKSKEMCEPNSSSIQTQIQVAF